MSNREKLLPCDRCPCGIADPIGDCGCVCHEDYAFGFADGMRRAHATLVARHLQLSGNPFNRRVCTELYAMATEIHTQTMEHLKGMGQRLRRRLAT